MHLQLLNSDNNLINGTNKLSFLSAQNSFQSWLPLTQTSRPQQKKQSDYLVEQSSFSLIEIGFMETNIHYEHLPPDLKHITVKNFQRPSSW